MRIARISTVPYFVVSQLSGQIGFLVQNDASVTVITSDGEELDKLRTAIPSLNIETMEIARKISLVQDMGALFRLFLLFRRGRFDIVHSTTPKAGLITAIAGKLAGVPVRLHTFTGQQWVHLHGPVRWVSRWSDWLVGKLNTHCYADSESQRQFLVEDGLISQQSMSVIGAGSLAGVDMDRFNPAKFSTQAKEATRRELGIPEQSPVLLFVGRITADKGVRELIAAFKGLKQKGIPVHLVMAGPLDTGKGNEDIAADLGTGGGHDVHLVGYTECPEKYMAIADILCLPSYREGFGTVVIEAAAMGVPTVGTNIYGLSDAVRNGETGILVEPRDPVALEAALSQLLQDERQRDGMGMAARQRVEKLFDANHVNREVFEEYRRLLAARGRDGA